MRHACHRKASTNRSHCFRLPPAAQTHKTCSRERGKLLLGPFCGWLLNALPFVFLFTKQNCTRRCCLWLQAHLLGWGLHASVCTQKCTPTPHSQPSQKEEESRAGEQRNLVKSGTAAAAAAATALLLVKPSWLVFGLSNCILWYG